MVGIGDRLQSYARRIRALRRAHTAASEPALAPAFQELLEAVLDALPVGAGLTVVPEYERAGLGRPDVALIRPGAPPRAFVELKTPDKPADPRRWRVPHDRRQFLRLAELACWATSNFVDIVLFERGEERARARIVPEEALDPACSDARADRLVRHHDPGPFLALLERLAAGARQPPAPRDARHLAELLAHSARLVRGIVEDRLAELRASGIHQDPLLDVHTEFRTVLYAHPEAGGYPAHDFDGPFAAAFAQTLAFGLLLVREATGRPVGEDAHRHMPAEHPLMRTALRVLTEPEILEVVGIGFTVLLDTVNAFDPEILASRTHEPDPILYFYEDFLAVFDPVARRRFGVYFTPVEVVRFMVGALDRVVREGLALQGLSDPRLTILDPATGTGTFLLAVAERVREAAVAAGGPGRVPLALRALLQRMFGFELLVGPYAVAHYRLHHALREALGAGAAGSPPRLGVYLADTLAEPGADAPLGRLGFVSAGIREERRAADRIKAQQPILAIIGNPPYRRLEEGETRTLVGAWMNALWDDLKRPVREAGQGNQLNTFPELSVAFWRWAIWKLFEAENAPGRGVVAFITNRKFLTGWPYAGLRKMMRERFDRIEIVDLRGDLRRGPRADVGDDEGVFDIQVGTAITIAVADGSRRGGPAEVRYLDAWGEGHLAREAKLEWLARGAADGRLPNAVEVRRDPLDDFRPAPFAGRGWPSLRDCFLFAHSGIETKRDHLVYDVHRDRLERRLAEFVRLAPEHAREPFHETRDRDAAGALAAGFDRARVREVAYRPLDRRYLYLHPRFCDFPRPELQRVWGERNVCLYAMAYGTGAGPAVWCHGLLPDRHAFRGSYGGYAFPLHDRRPGRTASNLAPALLAGLAAAYGREVRPEAVFDAILCLLSARAYGLRFAEDLEDAFPYVPFPADGEVFDRAAALGARLRAIETFDPAFSPPPLADPGFVRLVSAPKAGVALAVREPEGDRLVLGADGSGAVEGLPPALWSFRVSGYPVLRRWLEGRQGLPVDLLLFDAFRDVCARIAVLQALVVEADRILEAALSASLDRNLLGLPAGTEGEER